MDESDVVIKLWLSDGLMNKAVSTAEQNSEAVSIADTGNLYMYLKLVSTFKSNNLMVDESAINTWHGWLP